MTSETSESSKPSTAPRKTCTDVWIDAINSGNLEALKSGDPETHKPIRPSRKDINRTIFVHPSIVLTLKYTKKSKPITVDRPTLLQLAAICEQDEIMEWFIKNYPIDFSVLSGDKRHIIHIAAAVADYRPLALLMRYRYFQENVDFQYRLPGEMPRDGERTTALHIAVGYNHIRHVFILLTQYTEGISTEKDKPAEDEEEVVQVHGANVDQRTGGGSTALHSAVYRQNVNMVRVLLAFGGDVTTRDSKNESVKDLAARLKKTEEAKFQARKEAAEKHKGTYEPPKDFPLARICQILDNEAESPEELMSELGGNVVRIASVPHDGESSDEGDDDDERVVEEEEKKKEGDGKGSRKKHKKSDEKLVKMMRDLTKQVGRLEEQVKALSRQPGAITPGVIQGGGGNGGCAECHMTEAAQCNQCHNYYCDTCDGKGLHKCAQKR
jgi:ankyrin repeat protein